VLIEILAKAVAIVNTDCHYKHFTILLQTSKKSYYLIVILCASFELILNTKYMYLYQRIYFVVYVCYNFRLKSIVSVLQCYYVIIIDHVLIFDIFFINKYK